MRYLSPCRLGGRERGRLAQGISMSWGLIVRSSGLAAAISRYKAVKRTTRGKTRGSNGQVPLRRGPAVRIPVPSFCLASRSRVTIFLPL